MSHSAGIWALNEQYKEATKYPIAWLRSMDPQKDNRSQPYSTKDLVRVARAVAAQKLSVPGSVITNLQNAIAGRNTVLNIYLKSTTAAEEASNQSHAAFVQRLNEVLHLLSPLALKLTGQARDNLDEHAEPSGLSNRFAALHMDVSQGDSSSPENRTGAKHENTGSIPGNSEASVQPPHLEDDDLGALLQIAFFLREIDAVCQLVDSYWEDAAKRKLPISVSAWLSSAAYHVVGRMFGRLQHVAPSFDEFIKMWEEKILMSGFRARFVEVPELGERRKGRCTDTLALRRARRILTDCRDREDYRKISPNAGAPLNPVKFFVRPDADADFLNQMCMEDLALDQMQESMRQLLELGRAIAKFEGNGNENFISEPLLPLLKQFLNPSLTKGTAQESPPFQLVYGYELLLSTYKTYISAEDPRKRQNCRLVALRYAQEIKVSVSAAKTAVVGCKEDALQIPQLGLEVYLQDLDAYTQEKRFDLYYQSPWTAGCHINELQAAFRVYGIGLCCETGHVCAVLHLYKCLRALELSVKKITLLEQLCEIFRSHLFPSGLPNANFSIKFRAAMGHEMTNRPPDAGSLDNNPISIASRREFDTASLSRMSLFFDLHNQSYQTTKEDWVRIYKGPSAEPPKKRTVSGVLHAFNSKPINVSLDKMKQAVMAEFTGDLPIARVNFFAIFTYCADLLRKFGKALSSDPRIEASVMGFYATDLLLRELARHPKGGATMPPYSRHLKEARRLFDTINGDDSVLGYLWTQT